MLVEYLKTRGHRRNE